MISPASVRGQLRRRLDTETRVLVKNSSWFFIANAYRTLTAVAKSIIIARGLGAELYGTYVLIIAFVVTTQEFFNLNVGTAVIKFGADYRSAGREDKLIALAKAAALVSVVLAGVAVLVVAGLSTVAYDTFIGVPGLEPLVILYAVASTTAFLESVSTGLLRLFYKFRMNSFVQIAVATIDLGFMAGVLFLFPHQLVPFVIAMIVAQFFGTVVVNGAAVWEMRSEFWTHRRAPLRLIREDRRKIGAFVFANSGSRTLKVLMDRGDVLLLGAFSTVTQVGLYDLAKKLASTVLRFTDPLANSIYPQVASLLAAQRVKEVRQMLRRITISFTLPALAALAVAYFLDDWILSTLYGEEFAAAGPVFLVHLAAAFVSAVFFWALPVVQSMNLIMVRLKVTAVALIVGGVLGYFVAPVYGAIGVAGVSFLAKTYMTSDMVRASWSRLQSLSDRPRPVERADPNTEPALDTQVAG